MSSAALLGQEAKTSVVLAVGEALGNVELVFRRWLLGPHLFQTTRTKILRTCSDVSDDLHLLPLQTFLYFLLFPTSLVPHTRLVMMVFTIA